jgi:RNA polymerase sigma factor (sigma-70 family)
MGTDVTAPTDADLVRRCLEDDASAWSALTIRYADLVFRIARRSGLDEDGAGDVVQDVFLALLRSLRRLRRAERLVGWIARSARREAWRHVRRRRSRGRLERAVARPEADAHAPPDANLADLEMQQAVAQAFGALGERCRRLLDALFLAPHEPSYADVARDLGLAVGSIGSLRQRCLETLREELAALGVGEAATASRRRGRSGRPPAAPRSPG